MTIVNLVRGCTLGAALALAPAHATGAQTAPPRQTEADAYTRYELLAPGSAKFRIVYDVTATTAGATHYFNPIRAGSIATDEHVSDRATGKPLVFDVVGAAVARAGGVRVSDSLQQYIRVTLARTQRRLGAQRNACRRQRPTARHEPGHAQSPIWCSSS